MKFNEVMKKLKPTQWYHWVGYGTIGTVLASGIAIGVVFEFKGNNGDKPNTSDVIPNQKGGPSEKKRGQQIGLPETSNKSIDVKNKLIPNLIKKDILDVSKVVASFKALNIPVDISKGTSYDKKHGTHKVIGNKYHAIDRFIAAWNKLNLTEKSALNRHTFAYLFGYNPESNYHVGHQVEYILIDPINKISSTSNPGGSASGANPSSSSGGQKQIVVDDFVKWVKALKINDFVNLANSSKLPSEITSSDVLGIMKNLQSFIALKAADKSKLSNSNITLYNVFDKEGKISIKITQNGNELIKIKSLGGFKNVGISQATLDLANAYNKALSDSLKNLKALNNTNTNSIYYYGYNNGSSIVTYPIVGVSAQDLENNAKSALKQFGFTTEKIYTNLTNSDLNGSFAGKKSIRKPSLKIGYLSSKDKKYYLLYDHSTAYASIDDAISAFIKNSKSESLNDFVKSKLTSIKNELTDFGTLITTPGLDAIITQSLKGMASDIKSKLSSDKKTSLDALVNKYIPGDSSVSSTFSAKVFENKNGKYLNGSDELANGSKKYPVSFKIGNDYYAIWGLFNTKNGHVENNTATISKFKNFESSIFGHVDQIAVVDTGKIERSKKIAFVFFKIGNDWIFSTDYINYIEGGNPNGIVKIITNSTDTHSTDSIMNTDFSDLVSYTKNSLSQ